MNGLIYNLLDAMARNSGCADEAWNLVAEYVTDETEHESDSDVSLRDSKKLRELLAEALKKEP